MEEETVLVVGDILVHYEINEIGLLMNRFDVLHAPDCPLWAWDILWVGSEAQDAGRRQAYTEEGLKRLIISGVFIRYTSI
jgi:hypothetical protein